MITILVPGSKSITNRALLLAALAKGKSRILGALGSDDTNVMRRAIKKMSRGLLDSRQSLLSAKAGGGNDKRKLFCGNAGTAMRFLSAIAATQPIKTVLDGDSRMRKRPIGDLLQALRKLGAQAKSLKGNDCPPVEIRGPLAGGKTTVSGKISSQFLSGLLMAAPLAKKNVEISVRGELISKPYVDMTIRLMEKFGVRVERNEYRRFKIPAPQNYRAAKINIEGDASSASYFWGIGELAGEHIIVKNIPKNSLQADAALESKINGFLKRKGTVNVAAGNLPDGAITLACLSAFRDEKTTFTGLENLRVKESDRLTAVANELRRIGCRVKIKNDGWEIFGNPQKLRAAKIRTYHDHRIAMAFGMLSAAISGIRIENPSCVSKTYPNFWKDLARVKKQLSKRNIILTGMRGSGKTTLGKFLAKKLHRKFYDIDELIEKKAGQSIADFVAKKGWKAFRIHEKKVVRQLKNVKGSVIATGGGTLMDAQSAKILKKNGRVIFLDVPISILKKRLEKSKNRPSLTGKHFLAELMAVWKKRREKYEAVADKIIHANRGTIDIHEII